ncbi:glycine zipper family protein [Propionivibrio limicola]|uniref:glycine zipper family protein n=1 Tax=Propionivibrio limicola TaxID=167645 RepID=UPI001291E977|nr:glycine zipper family protein [Propionivibrio limicola]
MKSLTVLLALAGLTLFGGCASVPTGPSAMALPGTGKTLAQFNRDDAECRQYATNQLGGTTASGAATQAGVESAAVGTVVGALAGAAFGGQDGAAFGAGTGLLFGSMIGLGTAQSSYYATQQYYDNAYFQCMYARGQRVPVSGTVVRSSSGRTTTYPPLAPAGSYPPPPPGSPPPPPRAY